MKLGFANECRLAGWDLVCLEECLVCGNYALAAEMAVFTCQWGKGNVVTCDRFEEKKGYDGTFY